MSDWNFPINLAGVTPAGAGARALPTGYYKGKIVEADGTVASSGRPQVKFRVEIVESEHAGVVRTTWLGIPQSPEDNVRYYWRALFESAGYSPAQIEAGTINAQPALFTERAVLIHFTAGDKDAGTRDELKFLAPAAWEMGKKSEQAIASAPTGSALGGMQARVTTPAPVAAPMQAAPMQAAPMQSAGGLGGGFSMPNGSAPAAGGNAAALLSALGAR